ncbi:tannase/feruloyl esterase family alpha/beta hydrolase [Nocardioides sp.]|uniref:tannase/feruloyl esterase family alpha/beta hydrolase n=1 Tax=Nocardioides sp. TaxID=35761 RepID=UPI002B9F3A83|nr:tannase/feruloyl esterase family alpha/beta hydrolase [Nocardioides sp.]HXH79268.1 tannase/feruloyl esterase family alpha/beta hydrolase [Nocardioides sp.]
MTSTTKMMATRGAVLVLLTGTTLLGLAAGPAAPVPSWGSGLEGVGPCARADRLEVRGAEKQTFACLDDLTTAGTVVSGHTNQADWRGLHAPGTTNPTGVPGLQIDGYFPDTSTTNTNNGWQHDAQFVIRLPEEWNGGLVITGAPGVRGQYANDFIISDWVLSKGYAFASTDKGNTGASFYRDGSAPGGSIREWHRRVTELTRATARVVRSAYGDKADRTYMAGISNGGYLTRWQLENNPQLFDGGLDWEGTLFRAEGPNLLTFLPTALKHYPAYAATGDQQAHDAMIEAGFTPGSEFLWPFHHAYYWDLTQRIYREELDPEWDGALDAGVPFCTSGTPHCDADYDYDDRPAEVEDAVRSISLTGNIKRPMITVHGDLDTLLPPAVDSDVYDQLIDDAGRSRLHRYYLVEDGTHVDGLYAAYPDRLRPLLPCARDGFDLLTAWVEEGQAPAPDRFVPRPTGGDLVNTCSL